MKIFISWSGDQSKAVATALDKWLQDVFPDVQTWISDHIEAGVRWIDKLNNELDSTDFGILCLTADNLSEPWMLYEAGALGKFLVKAKVVPYLVGIKATDVEYPLAQFQAVTADEPGTLKLLKSINKARESESKLEETRMQRIFDKWWSDLKSVLDQKLPVQVKKPIRTQDAYLEEILSIVRKLSSPIKLSPARSLFKRIIQALGIADRPLRKSDIANATGLDFGETNATVDALYLSNVILREQKAGENEYRYYLRE